MHQMLHDHGRKQQQSSCEIAATSTALRDFLKNLGRRRAAFRKNTRRIVAIISCFELFSLLRFLVLFATISRKERFSCVFDRVVALPAAADVSLLDIRAGASASRCRGGAISPRRSVRALSGTGWGPE